MNIKLCFLIDCTSSMSPWITEVGKQVVNIIHTTSKKYPDAVLKVACIGYRDYGDPEQFIIWNFTTPIKAEYMIQNIRAEGGSDDAEDVAWALDKLRTAIDWHPSDIRIVYHIADAPAHGLQYHNDLITERFPEGDPDGLDPVEPLIWLSDNQIFYTFVRITRKTDKMISIFQDHYNPDFFNVLDLSAMGPIALYDSLTQELDRSITQYISSQDREED